MNSELANPEISGATCASSGPVASPKRHARRAVALLAVAVVGLSACNSDPGRKRVAEDIIDTAYDQGDLTKEQRDCMFDRVEQYSESQLEEVTKTANDAGPGTGIELFEADLAACK